MSGVFDFFSSPVICSGLIHAVLRVTVGWIEERIRDGVVL